MTTIEGIIANYEKINIAASIDIGSALSNVENLLKQRKIIAEQLMQAHFSEKKDAEALFDYLNAELKKILGI